METHGARSTLTQLRPDVVVAVIPQAHVELVVSREEHLLLDGVMFRNFGHTGHQRQKGTAVIRVRKRQRLDPREGLRRGELAQVRIVERLQVQQPAEACRRQVGEDVVAKVSERGKNSSVSKKNQISNKRFVWDIRTNLPA